MTEPNESRPTPPPSLPGSTAPAPSSSPNELDEQAVAAVTDLAERLGIEPGQITVRSDERVTWRDGSLGCPRPGMSYTQALVPGRRLLLSAAGATHAYHAGRDGVLFACSTPDPNGTAPGGLQD